MKSRGHGVRPQWGDSNVSGGAASKSSPTFLRDQSKMHDWAKFSEELGRGVKAGLVTPRQEAELVDKYLLHRWRIGLAFFILRKYVQLGLKRQKSQRIRASMRRTH